MGFYEEMQDLDNEFHAAIEDLEQEREKAHDKGLIKGLDSEFDLKQKQIFKDFSKRRTLLHEKYENG